MGAVTQEVLKRGFPVLAVEKDARFVEVLTQELMPEYAEYFKLVHSDILQSDLTELVTAWAGARKAKVIGNLPYYISTPILFHLIDHAEVFSRAVLMLQKEVAARLSAAAGEEDYSRLSVTSRLYGETQVLFDVSPSCFLPHPQVLSRVISFFFRPYAGKDRVKNEVRLLEIIRIAFSQRRKTLLTLLAHQLKTGASRKDLEGVFEKLGFSPQVRGEELSLGQFLALAGALG